MHEEIIARAGEIVQKNTGENSYCVLALVDLDGYPTASTITASKANGIKWLTFCTGLGSIRTNRIDKCNRASVCFNAEDYNITLVGTMEIVTDLDIKRKCGMRASLIILVVLKIPIIVCYVLTPNVTIS